jgi:1,4-alpha-glucan branching enzyme
VKEDAATPPPDGPPAPPGAHLAAGGATFRAWAPAAERVSVRGSFNGFTDHPLTRAADGQWQAFVPGVTAGDQYTFFVNGPGSEGPKRDPYARALTSDPPFPHSNCVITSPETYPWHDGAFTPPRFNDLILYQLHVGAFYSTDENGRDRRRQRPGRFLDLLFKIEYLAALGVNAVQLLPIQEFGTARSLGYNGTDYFAPEMDYAVQPSDPEFSIYIDEANRLLAARGHPPLAPEEVPWETKQLMTVIDLFHVYGIAVILDLVYNHAGGDFGDESIYFFDRQEPGDNNRSLYFTSAGWAGGLVFAYGKREVREFLIDNARFFLAAYHADGFRFDEVTVIDRNGGWSFLQDLTDALRDQKPQAPLIAEYWADQSSVVRARSDGGAGFDAVVAPGLRQAIRGALADAAHGKGAAVSMGAVASRLRPEHGDAWRTVQHLENHDIVRVNNDTDRQPRVPALADGSNPRSWYARSRSRVANGLLLTAPGIPMLFMGQEILEDKYWSDSPDFYDRTLIWWDGLDVDAAMRDHLRFVSDLIAIRHQLGALRGDRINVHHADDDNRVLAFHRWLDGVGEDVVVVASLHEETWWTYDLGFPRPGEWREVFNSDVYDGWPNAAAAGNGGRIEAAGPPRDGMPYSASIVIPANSIVVFAPVA